MKRSKDVVVVKHKKRSLPGLVMDIVLTICTGGLWLIVIAIRVIRKLIA